MKISELPKEIKEKALKNQKEASYNWDKETDELYLAFEWEKTLEGYYYWIKMHGKKKYIKQV